MRFVIRSCYKYLFITVKDIDEYRSVSSNLWLLDTKVIGIMLKEYDFDLEKPIREEIYFNGKQYSQYVGDESNDES